jgi:hypothetical protein
MENVYKQISLEWHLYQSIYCILIKKTNLYYCLVTVLGYRKHEKHVFLHLMFWSSKKRENKVNILIKSLWMKIL